MDCDAFSTALYECLHFDLGLAYRGPHDRFGDAYLPVCETADELARHSLLRSAFKKSECEVDSDAENRTLLKFLEANNACKEWTVPEVDNPAIGYSISYARILLRDWLEPHCGTTIRMAASTIEQRARFGPGQSAGLRSDRPSQYYFKIGDQPLTASSESLLSWYQQSVQNNPLCEAAEMARKARCGQADGVVDSKLGFVPKSYHARRITVTEPSVNTFFQLGAGGVLEDALQRHLGIDFSYQQERNQRLACEGSISGEFATMDLTQCSDYISQGLVRYMFPKSVRGWFNYIRSKRVDIPGLGIRELFMTGTMGNGFTFPMQTILLAAILLGVYKTLDLVAEPPSDQTDGNFGVYGDDIICLQRAYPLLTKVLTALGLRVNEEKSYACGPFRESCGADYFNGVNVRGVYFHNYRTTQDYLSIFNRLAIWGANHCIPMKKSLAFIASVLQDDARRYVPPDESIVSGVILPLPLIEEKDGWVFQRYVPVVSPFCIETWEYLQVEASKGSDYERTHRRAKWLKALQDKMEAFGGSLNEPAILKALLYGAIRRGSIVQRALRPSYKSVVSRTPRWGYTEQPLCAKLREDQIVLWNSMVLTATTVV